jgi:hypothetical protein
LLRNALAFPRGSTNIAGLLSREPEASENYKDGLITLASLIVAFVLIWGLILLYLKCKGNAVGCASGRAFEGSLPEEPGDKMGPNNGSTDIEEMSHSSKHEESQIMEQTSFPSSLCSSDAASQYESSVMSMSMGEESTESTLLVEGKRAIRTRMVFLVFSCIILACVPLSLAFSFAPVKDTVKSSDDVFVVRHITDFFSSHLPFSIPRPYSHLVLRSCNILFIRKLEMSWFRYVLH